MNLNRSEILLKLDNWVIAWNEHSLKSVMDFMHKDVVFENWNGAIVFGKKTLQKSWASWFENHHNFKFITEDIFIDETEQKITFQWCLEWNSFEKKYFGKKEIRRGIDILHLTDGEISRKIAYSKTNIQIDSVSVNLSVA